MQSISTRLTELLRIKHPILLAPMDIVADGRLAAAVSAAGGLGIIGAGYGDEAWLRREMDAAGEVRVGVGFITWSMAKRPKLLDIALERKPPAVMLSFGEISRMPKRSSGRAHCSFVRYKRSDRRRKLWRMMRISSWLRGPKAEGTVFRAARFRLYPPSWIWRLTPPLWQPKA